MNLHFSPVRMDASLQIEREGDCLTLNGQPFDFSALAPGQMLPAEAITSDWFTGPVWRDGQELHVTLRLPHGPVPPNTVQTGLDLQVHQDGPVPLPALSPETQP